MNYIFTKKYSIYKKYYLLNYVNLIYQNRIQYVALLSRFSTRPTASLSDGTRQLLKRLENGISFDTTETAPLRVACPPSPDSSILTEILFHFIRRLNQTIHHLQIINLRLTKPIHKKNLRRTASLSTNSYDSLMNLSILIHYFFLSFPIENLYPYADSPAKRKVKTDFLGEELKAYLLIKLIQLKLTKISIDEFVKEGHNETPLPSILISNYTNKMKADLFRSNQTREGL